MSIEELRAAEAEARARASLGHHPFCTSDWEPPQACNCAYAAQEDNLDAYAAAVRATLEGEVEALVDAALETRRWMLEYPKTDVPPTTWHPLDNALQPFLARRGR